MDSDLKLGKGWPSPLSDTEMDDLLLYLRERFGIPQSRLVEYKWLKKANTVYIIKDTPLLSKGMRYKVEQVGVRIMSFFRRDGAIFFVPNKCFVTVFGNDITKSRVLVSKEFFSQLKKGPISYIVSDLTPGLVLLSIEGIGDVGLCYYKNQVFRLNTSWI